VHYYIDGYNVTKRDPATQSFPLDEQRAALERRLRLRAASLLGRAAYTIIWDGAGGVGVTGHAGNTSAPHSQYTRQPTADDAIVARVRAADERIGVVTSDQGLAARCRSVVLHGVDILPAERLFEAAAPTRSAKGHKHKPLPRDVGIPEGADKINEELKKLWGIED
jgi:hypothetical protein